MFSSNVNSSQKCQSSQKPELIDLTQDEFVDLTQEISDNSSVTHVSETQMVVTDDSLSCKSDSSSKSEKPGIYNLFFSVNQLIKKKTMKVTVLKTLKSLKPTEHMYSSKKKTELYIHLRF